MNYKLTSPCPKCPFRNDIPAYLRAERVYELADSLERGEFACHLTTVSVESEDGEGERIETEDSQHCAGALILLEKLEQPSQMMRICERIGSYDASKLKMDAPVYDDFDEMADAQPL